MEHEIRQIETRLAADPDWRNALERLDQGFLNRSLENSKRITRYFGHENERTNLAVQALWFSLETQTIHFLEHLDATGISAVVGRVAPDYLVDFSFREAREFRRAEERLIEDLEIPEEAWNRFWHLIDENKNRLFTEMREQEPFSFRSLFPLIREHFEEEPVSFETMSPFSWSKAVATGLATTLGIVDYTTAVSSGGLSLVSAVVAGVAAAYVAGKS